MDAHYFELVQGSGNARRAHKSVNETLAPHPFICSLHLDIAAFALLTPPRQEALSHDT